jgi:tetratricopeptide (TPR) repeat protein
VRKVSTTSADGPTRSGRGAKPRSGARGTAKEGRGRVPPPRPHTTLSAEDILQRAIAATTARSRRLWARRGLSLRSALDRTTQSLLLRQLYLSYYEDRRFDKAAEISEQLVALDVLPDVAQQDAARAKQALGDIEGAASHLRLAARVAPASRRAFHFWTLGSLYFLARRYDEAAAALTRAARWGTTDKPLYQAHLALAQRAGGKSAEDLDAVIAHLEDAPAAQGYGRFVLGHLFYYAGRPDDARRHLEAFIRRTTGGRPAMAIALEGEVTRARETLAEIDRRSLAT